MNNTEKKLVTLKDYFDAGVIEKFSDFCIYDDECLKDWVGYPINLSSTIDKFMDCEVSSITSDPLGVPRRIAIYISTNKIREKDNLSDDDIKQLRRGLKTKTEKYQPAKVFVLQKDKLGYTHF